MKLIGEKLFAKDAEGRLVSRIGTMFFHTPGLVTRRGIHAAQRMMWLEALNAGRRASGRSPLSPEDEDEELQESVDLIFTETEVLIRPNPDRMDLAFMADAELQKLVLKPSIRFLNTNSAKVREALRERGENWRMARQPITQDDMIELIEKSKVAIDVAPVYRYNHLTGTRLLTANDFSGIGGLSAGDFRKQLEEIAKGVVKRNRHGHPEVDVFPPHGCEAIREALKTLDVGALDDQALRAKFDRIVRDWRMALPPTLREETPSNYEWRNSLCHALTQGPNETNAEEQELIAGIAPEFYRQIEWLPGARIDNGEVIFDPVYDEANRTRNPQLLALCDTRVKSFLFNTTRLLGNLRYINIGRIAHSLAHNPEAGSRRGHVYVMQYAEDQQDVPHVVMIRLQKWGVAEHLDEGKDLLQSVVESDEYSDYILDRRLMCRQLGMNLPHRVDYGHFTEKYHGSNPYNGVVVRSAYFIRAYIGGVASDKVPYSRYRNPVWSQKFAMLMGEAAAVDMVVGRRSSMTGGLLFDTNYEVVQTGADGLPVEIKVTDHAGSFSNYDRPFEEYVADYAQFAQSRRELVSDYGMFVNCYVEGFRRRLVVTQAAYRLRRRAFDNLFSDRPYDTNGSGAYRWACALKRLDACDPDAVASALKQAIEC